MLKGSGVNAVMVTASDTGISSGTVTMEAGKWKHQQSIKFFWLRVSLWLCIVNYNKYEYI